MIVVSNTSPLTNLAAIGRFNLLQDHFQQIHIAQGVWHELNANGSTWPGASEVRSATWITQHTPANIPLVTALRNHLDRGESETIALATELNADVVLLDERDGRHVAQGMGLQIMGVVGILIAAKQKGFIPVLKPELDALINRAGFYLGRNIYHSALQAAMEG